MFVPDYTDISFLVSPFAGRRAEDEKDEVRNELFVHAFPRYIPLFSVDHFINSSYPTFSSFF